MDNYYSLSIYLFVYLLFIWLIFVCVISLCVFWVGNCLCIWLIMFLHVIHYLQCRLHPGQTSSLSQAKGEILLGSGLTFQRTAACRCWGPPDSTDTSASPSRQCPRSHNWSGCLLGCLFVCSGWSLWRSCFEWSMPGWCRWATGPPSGHCV